MAKRVSPALWGWLAIAGVVVGYDAWALTTHKETLTSFFYRLIDDPLPEEKTGLVLAVKAGVTACWLGTTWHLLSAGRHLLPDPYHAKYRQVHPLWRLHDAAILRAANGQLIAVTPVD